MGLAEITGIINFGTEPVWHAWLKVIVGLLGVAVPFVMEKQINLALYIVSGGLAVMGVLGLIPGLNYAVEPIWHPVLKLVAGGAGLYIAYMKKKK